MKPRDFWPYAPLLVVLLLAAGLRLYRLDAIDVRFDEASAPQLARGITEGVLLRVAPFSGSVASHPPVYLYALAPPFLFTRDFLAVATYRQMLELAAIALTWLLARRFFNARTAFLAALLFAVAPWAVQMSRKLWLAPLPLFTVMWAWGACEVLARKQPRGWFWLGLGLALSLGSHLSAVYLAPVTALVIVLGRRELRVKPALTGLAPLALLAALYLSHDAGQDFKNVRALLGAGASAATAAPISPGPGALDMALWGSGGARISDLTGDAFGAWRAQTPAWLDHIDTLQNLLVLLSIGALAFGLARGSPSNASGAPSRVVLFLIAWQVLPVLLQLRPSRPPQMHYFTILWPGAWLLFAILFDRVLALSRNLTLRSVFQVALLAIVAWQIMTTLRFADFVMSHDTARGGYGDPARAGLQAAALARQAVRSGAAADIIIVAPGGDPATDEPATVLDVLLADLPRRFVRADDALVLRGEPTHYVFAPGTDAAFARLGEFGVIERVVLPTRERSDANAPANTRAYQYVRMAAASVPVRPGVVAPSVRWSNGARLLATRAQSGDGAITVDFWLSVEAQPVGDQHWFVRVLDASGAQLGSRDIGGVDWRSWRVGDVLALRFEVPVAGAMTDIAALRIGSYAYPEIQQTAVIDAAGNSIDDGVTVPLPRLQSNIKSK